MNMHVFKRLFCFHYWVLILLISLCLLWLGQYWIFLRAGMTLLLRTWDVYLGFCCKLCSIASLNLSLNGLNIPCWLYLLNFALIAGAHILDLYILTSIIKHRSMCWPHITKIVVETEVLCHTQWEHDGISQADNWMGIYVVDTSCRHGKKIIGKSLSPFWI